MIVMIVAIMFVVMLVLMGMIVRFVIVVFAMGLVMGLVRMRLEIVVIAFTRMAFEDLRLGRSIGAGALDDLAADAIAIAATARIAVT